MRKTLLLALAIAILLGMARPQVARAGDIYLTINGRGSGRGTARHPYDCSASGRYDEILSAAPLNTTFHYDGTRQSPHVFVTRGWDVHKQPTARPGCHHIGRGMDATIIRLVEPFGGVMFGCDYNQTADGFTLQNMTLDCNAMGSAAFHNHRGACIAYNVNGSNLSLDHVKVIGFGTGVRGGECFPVFSVPNHAAGTSFHNVVVQNCIFTAPATGNQDGLSCVAIGGGVGVTMQGIVQNCQFINIAGDFTYAHAFGAPLCQHNTVIQNIPPARCGQEGYYAEPEDSNSNSNITVVIQDNTFDGVARPLHILTHPNGTTGDVIFRNNICKNLPNDATTDAISIAQGDPVGPKLPTIKSMTITGNRFSVRGSTTTPPLCRIIDLGHGQYYLGSTIIRDNVFSPAVPSGREICVYADPMFIGSQRIEGNTYDNGQLVRVTLQSNEASIKRY